MEYSYLEGPTTIIKEALPIDELLTMIDQKLGFVRNILNVFNSAAVSIDEASNLYENISKFKNQTDALDKMKGSYKTKFNDLNNAVIDLAAAYDDIDNEDYDKNLRAASRAFETAKREYNQINDKIRIAMNDYAKLINSNSDSISKIVSSVASAADDVYHLGANIDSNKSMSSDIQKELDRMVREDSVEVKNSPDYIAGANMKAAYDAKVAETETNKALIESSNQFLSATLGSMDDSMKDYSAATLQPYIKMFNDQYTAVSKLTINAANYDDYFSGIEEDPYHLAEIDGYIPASKFDEFLAAQEETFKDSSLSAIIDGFVAFYKTIMKTTVFYDSELSANIDESFYNTLVGGLPGGPDAESWVLEFMRSAGGVMDTCDELKAVLWDDSASLWTNIINYINPISLIWKILRLIFNLIKLIIEFVKIIIKTIGIIIGNLKDAFTSYEHWLLSAYSAYNMPCRTDNKPSGLSFTAMTGSKFSGAGFLAQQSPLMGFDITGFAALANDISASKSGGGDITFSGAELEYIMYGFNSEISNQVCVFIAMYFLRLIMGLPFTLANKEVQGIAKASTYGYPIVIALYILLEPMADMLVLVNGGDVSLLKTTVFLTPTGLPKLVSSLVSNKFVDIKESSNKAMKKMFAVTDDAKYNDHMQAAKKNTPTSAAPSTPKIPIPDLFMLNYRNHCFLLMLAIPKEVEQLARIQNIIQMEGYYHYRHTMGGRPFDLKNAYAAISSETTATVKQFMGMPTLSNTSLFTVRRVQMRGY